MYSSEYYPHTVDNLGPMIWTPCDIATPTKISETVWIFDEKKDKMRTVSKAEKSAAVLLGFNGNTPNLFTISWKEVSDASTPAPALNEFTETVMTSALTVADVLRVFKTAYISRKALPPAGMTLRWFLTDVMNRSLRIEFKTHAERLRQEAEIDALTDDTPSYSPPSYADSHQFPLVPGGPATVQRV